MGPPTRHYMRGLATKAFARGYNVVRLNQRNCGDTEHLSAGLFHSGLTHDAHQVIAELTAVDGLPSIAVAGYSLGGNLALKLAAEYGDHAPDSLCAVAAVSPIVEIAECVDALERPGNVLYQWNFVKDLKRRMRRKERVRPGHFDLRRLDAIRSVREFDDVYTAPYFGFRDASDYYHRASAMRIIDRVRVPTLVISAEDDPFVPARPFTDPRLSANPSTSSSASTAAIADSSGRRRERMTATGRRARSSTSWSEPSAPAPRSAAKNRTQCPSDNRAADRRAQRARGAFGGGIDQTVVMSASRPRRANRIFDKPPTMPPNGESCGCAGAPGAATGGTPAVGGVAGPCAVPPTFDAVRALSFSYADSRSTA
jgi:pimeloyl-ACP methyl ester carboxylesterase